VDGVHNNDARIRTPGLKPGCDAADTWAVQVRYRRLTSAQRTDHIEALVLLGRLVTGLPTVYAIRRLFVVMTAIDTW
jgi:hypothetical protein